MGDDIEECPRQYKGGKRKGGYGSRENVGESGEAYRGIMAETIQGAEAYER